MASEAKILQPIVRDASVYCRIYYELTYQTVMRSCYKPGRMLLNTRWERTLPGGRRILKAKLSEARSTSLLVVRSHYLRRFSRAFALDTILPGL